MQKFKETQIKKCCSALNPFELNTDLQRMHSTAQDEKQSLKVSHHGILHRILKQGDRAWIGRGNIHQN